jgi:hypothetical protein
MSRSSRKQVHLVTQARTSKSDDIGYRERRYLIMMGIRVACFLLAVLMVTQGAGWLAAFPAVGALVIPYFAVVFANGGREPTDTRGFREYEPNLPEPHPGPAAAGQANPRDGVISTTQQPGTQPAGPGAAVGPGAAAAAGGAPAGPAAGGTGPAEQAAATRSPAPPGQDSARREAAGPSRPADSYIRAAPPREGAGGATRIPPAAAGRQAPSGTVQSGQEKRDANG